LCDVVGLSYDEISEATDAPVGTVRSRIHRGRKLLREILTWPV
jgi:RNA polymerase sigma-70 factor (ECF subfamily)